MQSAECLVQSAECRVQGAECRVSPSPASPPDHCWCGEAGEATLTSQAVGELDYEHVGRFGVGQVTDALTQVELSCVAEAGTSMLPNQE